MSFWWTGFRCRGLFGHGVRWSNILDLVLSHWIICNTSAMSQIKMLSENSHLRIQNAMSKRTTINSHISSSKQQVQRCQLRTQYYSQLHQLLLPKQHPPGFHPTTRYHGPQASGIQLLSVTLCLLQELAYQLHWRRDQVSSSIDDRGIDICRRSDEFNTKKSLLKRT